MLAVWRVTFAYQGTPLAVYGRGVKGDLKLFPLPLAKFAIRGMLEKRKRAKQARRQARRETRREANA